MTYTYTPRGVCSRKMTVELENGVIKSVSVEGGCNGNLQGISRLVVGMDAQDAIERMKGIHCGPIQDLGQNSFLFFYGLSTIHRTVVYSTHT